MLVTSPARRICIAVVRVHGFHAWPDAPGPVGYLAARHRHLFTVRVEFGVQHGDRAVEFHLAQAAILDALRKAWPCSSSAVPEFEFGASSCEHIAENLEVFLSRDFAIPSAIEVWEDDESGGRVEFVTTEVGGEAWTL